MLKRSIKSTTIFRQLILNVVIPVVIALMILAGLNYYTTRNLLIESNQTKNYIISDEIRHIMEFQDVALGLLETRLNERMKRFNDILIEEEFFNTDSIESTDLNEIRKKIGMNPSFEDIYIINRDGIVVNTTFEKDLYLNFFDFGEEHKSYLLNILKNGEFVNERFAIEHTTKRLKKYSYQPTSDGKYIIELGCYSKKADEIIGFIQNTISNISNNVKSIQSVDLFIGEDNPFSLNKNAMLNDAHLKTILNVFQEKDTNSITENENGAELDYEYIYMERKNTDLYKGSVIRIISDKSDDQRLLRIELLKAILIFGLTIIAVIFLIYNKTRVITRPLKKLVNNVNRIADGNLEDRAEVEGNNEITKLSEHFNFMLEKIEGYYQDLDRKVQERTAEVVAQKEEIQAQRDSLADKNNKLETAYGQIEDQNKHITDSIRYAKRIQTAILPPDKYVKKLLPDSFILYRPKDIVSGDFYWISEKDEYVMFSAVDCTGHGVPGAFMSIVGNDQLNYAVNVKGSRKPAEILDQLNKGVTNSLRQDATNTGVKDGMDISLCSINFKEKKLLFAGAFNPLYLIRNNELLIYKGDKTPVGAYNPNENMIFNDHEVDLIKGDTIYIFSDGYADQFGGPMNKKLLYKRFKQILIDIQDKPMNEQKDILEKKLFEWMGDNEQVDDILVIGVKI